MRLRGNDMNSRPPRLPQVLILLAAAGLSNACTRHGGSESKNPFPPTTPPSIDGGWTATSSMAVSNCPSTIPVVPIGFPECFIRTTTSSPGISCGLGCSNDCTGGPLTMIGDTISFALSRTIVLTDTCSLAVTETDAGTFTESMVTGAATLSVTALGGCGPGFPCQIQGSFVLLPRPPVPPGILLPDCVVPWCGPPP